MTAYLGGNRQTMGQIADRARRVLGPLHRHSVQSVAERHENSTAPERQALRAQVREAP